MEFDYIQISLLHSFAYCKRRAMLSILEKNKAENSLVVEGKIAHEDIHKHSISKYNSYTEIKNLLIYSKQLNVLGRADVVKFYKNINGNYIDFLNNKYSIEIIEYKHGTNRETIDYAIQLCLQAICIEEMYKTKINKSYIYYYQEDKLQEIVLTKELRNKTLLLLEEIKKYITEEIIPEPILLKRCNKCAYFKYCEPLKYNASKYVFELKEDLKID